ncbi:MAG: hypothetical protein NVSMB52_19200 [Chloroflexota bacterium]
MATRRKRLSLTNANVERALSERNAVRCDAGIENEYDSFGDYVANDPGGFVARFEQAQQALNSCDANQVRQLGDTARHAHAEAIIANYPR